jgi:ubiquinone/menaquinone biosynthesis C-methylase UbiE
MIQPQNNIFQELFEVDRYIALKNYLYNYRLRKKALNKTVREEKLGLILEVGTGISPIVEDTENIIYSDLSMRALQVLKSRQKRGWMVVADAMCLPFKVDVFTHVICSEVLEHLPDDRRAMKELARIVKPSGYLHITFPHRKCYFANDDKFVNHFRRYELYEMKKRLCEVGLKIVSVRKVLGPMEKLTMSVAVACFRMIKTFKLKRTEKRLNPRIISLFKFVNLVYSGLMKLDAIVMPRVLSTVLLVKAKKDNEKGYR